MYRSQFVSLEYVAHDLTRTSLFSYSILLYCQGKQDLTLTSRYPFLFYSTLLYTSVLYSTLLYSSTVYSTLLNSTFTLVKQNSPLTLLYSTLLYSNLALFYCTVFLLFSTLLYPILSQQRQSRGDRLHVREHRQPHRRRQLRQVEGDHRDENRVLLF